MFEFRSQKSGFYFYDPVLRREVFAPNTILFLLGYSRSFGDIKVSDKLFIPFYTLDTDGNPIALTNQSFQLKVQDYLTSLDKVEFTESGLVFELYGLTEVLEQIGFYTYYKSSLPVNSRLDRVPHIPLFTKRSQDYKRIKDILTLKRYWCLDEDKQIPDSANPLVDPDTREEEYPLYTVYNTSYKGDRAEALDLYKSFGSYNYLTKHLYQEIEKPVKEYADYCSWFIWDSLSLPTLYQFSQGFLYGMSQQGWGLMPYSVRPSEYAVGYKYIQMADEAFFWFQNTPFDNTGTNDIYNIDPALFRIDTYPVTLSRRVLSSSIDQDYYYNPLTGLYSTDGTTWITLEALEQWAFENNGALPVNAYTTSLYRANISLGLPLSEGNWNIGD